MKPQLLAKLFRSTRKFVQGVAIPLLLVVVGSITGTSTAQAATTSDNMTISLLGWNILGLDSNNQTVGPNNYPLGARVCNKSASPIDPTISWAWGNSVDTYITLASGATQYARQIPAAVGGTPTCADFWWEVGVLRTSAAFDQTRPFTISAVLAGGETVTSDTRTVLVERLVSQNRNTIVSITGPTSVDLGQTATYVMEGTTSTSYDQLTAWPKVDMNFFQVQTINFTYDTPSGQPAVDQFYKDACGWDYVTYTCTGSGKAGGNLVVTIVVKAIAPGAAIFSGTIYDKSGSSYHYNGDFGSTFEVGVAPEGIDDSATTAHATSTSGDVSTNDTYPAGATFTKTTDPAHGSVTVNANGSYTYSPSSGFSGTDSFTYDVCLAAPNATTCDSATVTVVVGPQANDDNFDVAFETPYVGTVVANDTYAENSTFTKTSDPSHGSVTLNSDGSFTYTPADGYAGDDSFTYTVCLASPNDTMCSEATVTVTIAEAAVPPTAVDDSKATAFDTAVGGDVKGNDTYPVGATFEPTSSPAYGSLAFQVDGTYTYTPTTGYSGQDSFTYQLCLPAPNAATCSSATVNITVAPYAADDAEVTLYETEVLGDVKGNDSYAFGSTFTKLSDPTNGSAIFNADGTYTYTPAMGFTGVDSFDYQVCLPVPDAETCSTATVEIVVGPMASNDSQTTAFETQVSGDVSGNDTYPVGATFAKVSDPSHGTVAVDSDGTYDYTPATGFSGIATFDYKVCLPSPNATVCSTATVSIVVGPSANDDKETTAFETQVDALVTANDTYPVGSSFEKTTEPTYGSVIVNFDGSYSYMPSVGFTGTDLFDYKVCLPKPDGALCATATVTIVVGPDAVDDSKSTAFETAVNGDVTGNDASPEGGTFGKVTDPSNGSVSFSADGTYTYTPSAGFSGADSFDYQVCMPAPDATVCSTATVTIVVGPKAVDDSAVMEKDTQLDGNLTDNDAYPAGSNFQKVVDPTNGTVTVNPDGTYAYTPVPGFVGRDTFTYKVCLSSPHETMCSTATVTIDVGLKATNDVKTAPASGPIEGDVKDNDMYPVDGLFAKVTDPSNGSVTVNSDGTYSYTPNEGFSGVDSFDYQVCLPDSSICSVATVTLIVAPSAVNNRESTSFDTRLDGDVKGNDLYPSGSSFDKVTDPSNGAVTFNSDGTYTYTPNLGFAGEDSFDYKVCMPSPNDTVCAIANVTIVVSPDAADDSESTPFETEVIGDVKGNDAYATGSIFEKVTDPSNGSVAFNADGTYTYTPNVDFIGPDSFDYKVCLAAPDDALCSTATVTIVVGPQAVDDAETTPFETELSADVTDNDTHPVDASIEKVTDPSNGSVTFNPDGTYTYTPNAGFTGTDSFDYKICLPEPHEMLCSSATVTIVVGPNAVDDGKTTPFESDVAGDVTGNDTAPVDATFEKVTDPSNGSVAFNADGTYTYTPNAGFTGTDSFDYKICLAAPDDALCSSATVTIVVGPDAVDDSEITPFNVELNADVTANDTYVDGSTFEKLTDPSNGLVVFDSDGTYTYTPSLDFVGEDSFTYEVCLPSPNETLCASATVRIIVDPLAVEDSEVTPFETPVSGDVTGNDTFPYGAKFEKVTDPSDGSVTFNSDGTYTYTPNEGFSGVDTFVYKVCLPAPDSSVCSSATVTIVVGPATIDDSDTTTTDSPTDGDLSDGGDFPPGSTFEKVTDPSDGNVTVNPDGTYTYTPNEGFTGTDSFTYKVCLPAPHQSVCSTGTVTIVIQAPPIAPPKATSDKKATPIDTPVSGDVANNDEFPPGSTFKKFKGPVHGFLSMNADGTFTYTPDPGFSGTDTFQYLACLPAPRQNECTVASVTIDIGDASEMESRNLPNTGAGDFNRLAIVALLAMSAGVALLVTTRRRSN